ncbi:hypothetical protein [Pseudanabaena sp. PCC 6802]|uniref:hypothetical protein n=1 Tax=Pseudanabaena sp. PCC 6802 TaxID=118173 RepID=UPI0003455C82|nr:hypothetical protein [Pseudanabaena sp. PCC 6802]
MTKEFSRSPDDLPPSQTTQIDSFLRRQLEVAIGKNFYDACPNKIEVLLSSCEWYFTTDSSAMTLVINCPDLKTSWSVLNEVFAIATTLKSFVSIGKIRISPPPSKGDPFEMRIDELDIYRD